MASIFMRIVGVKPKGVATINDINGEQGWFQLQDYHWDLSRAMSIDFGSASNAEIGTLMVSPFVFTKPFDGASPYFLAWILKPGTKKVDVEVVVTKTARDGPGVDVFRFIKISGARLAAFGESASDNGHPTEHGTLIGVRVTMKDWIEDNTGDSDEDKTLVEHQEIEYHVGKGEMISGLK